MYWDKKNWVTFVPRVIMMGLGGLALAGLLGLLFGYVVMWLWNQTLVPILHVSALSFWQAVGVLILSKLLFGTFGHHHSHPRHPIPGHGDCGPDMRDPRRFHAFWEREGREAYRRFVDSEGSHQEEKPQA
jgi:hypothetical protein